MESGLQNWGVGVRVNSKLCWVYKYIFQAEKPEELAWVLRHNPGLLQALGRKSGGRIIYLCESIASSLRSRHHLDSALLHTMPLLTPAQFRHGVEPTTAQQSPWPAPALHSCPCQPPLPTASAVQGSAPQQIIPLIISAESLNSLLLPFTIQSYTKLLCICSVLTEQSKNEHTAPVWHSQGDLKNTIIRKQ